MQATRFVTFADDGLVIALHSPGGVFETALLGCLPEKRAPKRAGSMSRTYNFPEARLDNIRVADDSRG
jgi:hypothetical protein